MHTFLLAMQWPGLVLGLAGGWLVGYDSREARFWGFTCWVISDLFWILYGLPQGWSAIGFQAMQVAFTVSSARAAFNNRNRTCLPNK